jgi:hypothetical protein
MVFGFEPFWAPMHLGLKTGPLCPIFYTKLKEPCSSSKVPGGPCSTQESPVPLLKIQMAPRLIIIMSSGSKKGTQIYFPFLSKVPAEEPPLGFQTGPIWRERGPLTGHFAYLSKTSSFEFSSKGALPQGPLHGIPHRGPTTRALLHSSIKVPGTQAPPTYQVSLGWKGAPHGERDPYPATFLTYLPGSPVKELPPKAPSTEPLQRERERERETLHPQSPTLMFGHFPFLINIIYDLEYLIMSNSKILCL